MDDHSGASTGEERFYASTGWDPLQLNRCSVLEVGSRAGRFSEVFLRTTTGDLHSVDYSDSVDANWRKNHVYAQRLKLVQASIYELPFADNTFDKVFCLGVLQLTPSFADSVAAIISKICIGGEIVVDFYPINGWLTRIHSKYFLRPLLKHLPKSLFLGLVRLNISCMLALFDFLCSLGLGFLTRFILIPMLRFSSNT